MKINLLEYSRLGNLPYKEKALKATNDAIIGVKDFDEDGNLTQDRNYAFNTQEGKSYYFIGDHEEKGEMQNGLREGQN